MCDDQKWIDKFNLLIAEKNREIAGLEYQLKDYAEKQARLDELRWGVKFIGATIKNRLGLEEKLQQLEAGIIKLEKNTMYKVQRTGHDISHKK